MRRGGATRAGLQILIRCGCVPSRPVPGRSALSPCRHAATLRASQMAPVLGHHMLIDQDIVYATSAGKPSYNVMAPLPQSRADQWGSTGEWSLGGQEPAPAEDESKRRETQSTEYVRRSQTGRVGDVGWGCYTTNPYETVTNGRKECAAATALAPPTARCCAASVHTQHRHHPTLHEPSLPARAAAPRAWRFPRAVLLASTFALPEPPRPADPGAMRPAAAPRA